MCLSIAGSLWPFYYLFMHCAHCHRVSSVFAANDQFGAIKHVNELGKKRSDNVRKTRRKNYLKGAKCELRTRIARRRGRGMVTKCRSSYYIECNVLQLQHNHKRTDKIRYPWPISAVANLSIVGAFDNMHKRYRYCWFIDATCAATAAHCLLVTPVLPLLLPIPFSRVGDCLIYCLFAPLYSFSSFCALNFECFFITFFFWWAEDENSLRVLQIEYVNVDYYDKHADESAHCSCLSITCKPGTINKAGKTCAFAKVWHTYKNYIYICMNLYA